MLAVLGNAWLACRGWALTECLLQALIPPIQFRMRLEMEPLEMFWRFVMVVKLAWCGVYERVCESIRIYPGECHV